MKATETKQQQSAVLPLSLYVALSDILLLNAFTVAVSLVALKFQVYDISYCLFTYLHIILIKKLTVRDKAWQ